MSDRGETAGMAETAWTAGAADPPRRTDLLLQDDPLGPAVRALFTELSRAGDALAASAADTVLTGEAGNIEHGTRVRFSLQMRGDRVSQARYRAYGCPYTLACCEWLARRLCDAQLPVAADATRAHRLAAAVGTPVDWAAALGIPQARLGRLLVIEDALRAMSPAGRP